MINAEKMINAELKQQLDRFESALEKSLSGYADAIETAYKHGALDAFNDNLANPPAVLWDRSKLKKEMEKGE